MTADASKPPSDHVPVIYLRKTHIEVPGAGLPVPSGKVDVSIKEITREEYGWLTSGNGKFVEKSQFQGIVGETYRELARAIPIELAEMPCPKCGSTNDMRYEILKIRQTHKKAYSFVAKVECQRCKHRSYLTQTFKNIADALGLEVSFLGLKLKFGA
jgi:DNA-directed RNA polymerase subunit M/transcription elongation factor TFIIS